MGYRTIILDKKNGVATVTMNRPDKKNAANREMVEDINSAFIDIARDPEVRVAVITGQNNFFCAGEDVTGFHFDSVAGGIEYMRAVVAAYKTMEHMPKVVVGAVNGVAYGYGSGIILACDIVYASDKAKFGLRQIKWGLIPADILVRGPESMSKKDIAYYSLTGDDVTPEEAKAMGWITKVYPHDQLMNEVYALAERLKNGPPVAQATIKRMLNRKATEDYDSYIEIIAALFATEDAANARKAFMEKRVPVFRGR